MSLYNIELNYVPVVEFNRGCQFTDEKWHVCARLAYTVTYVKYAGEGCGRGDYRSFRCRKHEGWISPTDHSGAVSDKLMAGITFGLGYKR